MSNADRFTRISDRLLESMGQTLASMAQQLAKGEPWNGQQCEAAELLVKNCIAGSTSRSYRLDSEAEDRVVDAAAEARGE